MLSKIKLFYVKTRLESFKHMIPQIKQELYNVEFHKHHYNFIENGNPKYYEIRYLMSIVNSTPSFDTSSMLKYERINFEDSLEKIREFTQFYAFYNSVSDLMKQMFQAYVEANAEIATTNISHVTYFSDNVKREEYSQFVETYNKLLEDVKEYPEWKEKIEQELGNFVHQLFTFHVSDGKTEMNPLEKFDKHRFFK